MYNHAPAGYECPFCLIARAVENDFLATKQSDIIYKDDRLIAWIASKQFKTNQGATVISPLAHYENLYDLPSEYGNELLSFAKKTSFAMKDAYRCDGTTLIQHNEPHGGQSVWHYHLLVFPRFSGDAFFENCTDGYDTTPSERLLYAVKLRSALNSQ